MKRSGLFVLLYLFGCDHAPAEQVTHLSLQVDKVEAEQQEIHRQQGAVRKQVETTALAQESLQSDFTRMGAGFNSLTENMIQQEDRMVQVEQGSKRLQADFGKLRDDVRARAPKKPSPDAPVYSGIRLDTRTFQEDTVRLKWCEAAEGTQGFLVPYGDELLYDDLRCWQFGDVAIFRAETPEGPSVTCLRNITFEGGASLKALDCDVPGVIYEFAGTQ